MSDEVGVGLMAALSENRPQRSNWDKAKGAVGTGNLKSGLPAAARADEARSQPE